MGAFFTNIHVKLHPEAHADSVRAVRDAVIQLATSEGFDIASPGDPVDRTILIAETSSRDWITLYDENSDGMDIKALERLAKATSRDSFAISALVADSDDLVMSLFRNGRRADRLVFNAEIVPSPKPAWRNLLGDNYTAFQEAFRQPTPFAEEPLEKLTELLAWDPNFAFLGYRHRDELPEGSFTKLEFMLRPELRFYTLEVGPTKITATTVLHQVMLVAGWRLEELGCGTEFRNEGGPSRGLTVIVELTPQLEEFTEIIGIKIRVGEPAHEMSGDAEIVVANDKRYLRVRFPSLDLKPLPVYETPLKDWQAMKVSEIGRQASFWVTVLGVATKVGKCTMSVWVAPHANPREGATVVDFKVTIVDKPWWGAV